MARWRPRFLIILAAWLILPIYASGQLAQDALQVVVTGSLVREYPRELYNPVAGGIFDRRECEVTPPDVECGVYQSAWVAPPVAIPIAWFFGGLLPPTVGMVLLRFLAAGTLIAGMEVLWRRCAASSVHAPQALVVSAVLLTPMAYLPIALGQTSPLLFLSACLGPGLAGRGRRSDIGRGLLWGFNVVIKLFPAALVLLLLVRRRWRTLLVGAGFVVAMFALATALAPFAVWGDYFAFTRGYAADAPGIAYNGAFDIVVYAIAPEASKSPVLQAALRVAAFAVLAPLVARVRDAHTQWAFAYLAALPLGSLIWFHYLWVAIPAVAYALATSTVPDRVKVALPVVAGAAAVLSIPNGLGTAAQVPQVLFLVGTMALTAWLTRPDRAADTVIAPD